jgi:NADPH:quinone reductase-like Zn-dependent oxidoreductase
MWRVRSGDARNAAVEIISLPRLEGYIRVDIDSFGHKPIGVSSRRHFELVKSRGAVKAFDYHSVSCAQDIRTYTKNRLAYIIDPMADVRTMTRCYAAMGRAGGKYCALEAYSEELTTSRKVVRPELIMGMSIFGKRVALKYGYEKEADPESRVGKIFSSRRNSSVR